MNLEPAAIHATLVAVVKRVSRKALADLALIPSRGSARSVDRHSGVHGHEPATPAGSARVVGTNLLRSGVFARTDGIDVRGDWRQED